MLLRDATAADAPELAAIYAPHVLIGTASFELDPPDGGAMAARLAAVQDRGWPWLVAEQESRLLGYCYASQFRDRPAYRHTGETSIYVRDDALRQGVGRALLAALIERARAIDVRQLVAVIGDGANTASISLHAAVGFRRAGKLDAVGLKFGRWLDVIYMQREL